MRTLRSAYGPKARTGINITEPSLTKQSFTKECDINNILKKYQKTGAVDHVNKHEATYGYASSMDFTEAMETVAKGQTMFDQLPSSIRTKFENDPAKFLDFVQDEKNKEEMQELGLAHKTKDKNEKEQEPLPAKQSGATKDEVKAGSETKTSESEAKG